MSILNNLKKNSKKDTSAVLKAGIVLLLDNQEQFNKLASCFGLEEDSISIDGIYVAYMDFQDTLTIHSIFDFSDNTDSLLEALSHRNLKPIDFKKWYKKIKG